MILVLNKEVLCKEVRPVFYGQCKLFETPIAHFLRLGDFLSSMETFQENLKIKNKTFLFTCWIFLKSPKTFLVGDFLDQGDDFTDQD